MAMETLKEKLTLRLELDEGIVDGKQKLKTKSFSQVKVGASDEALYISGQALAGLQEKDLLNVKKVEVSSIWED